jgi:flagellar basal-body rod protein FlgB
MFIDDVVSSGATPTLERLLRFTEVRQNLLTEDVANVSTPGYRQKDMSVAAFQRALQARLAKGEHATDATDGSDDPMAAAVVNMPGGILSHDGNNRSMEQLMSEGAKNALMHNTVVELLRRQYQTMEMALKGQVS